MFFIKQQQSASCTQLLITHQTRPSVSGPPFSHWPFPGRPCQVPPSATDPSQAVRVRSPLQPLALPRPSL
ncbi:hypothetical protein KUCAC02_021955 [Chaenocephalus aceratus]|nr:hypothetical protein KUCAC02_021955 [Chaenocephalus aceratus]